MRCLATGATARSFGVGLMVAIGATTASHADEERSASAGPLGTASLATFASSRLTGDVPSEPTARLTRSDPVDDPARPLAGRRGESSDLHYHWWLNRGRADIGFGLGTLTYALRANGAAPASAPPGHPGATEFAIGSFTTVGMRYRTSARSSVFADAIRWQGNGADGGDATVSGKVGVEFKSARSQWNVAYGGLGLRLAGDARMTLKVRRGGLGLYMRTAF